MMCTKKVAKGRTLIRMAPAVQMVVTMKINQTIIKKRKAVEKS